MRVLELGVCVAECGFPSCVMACWLAGLAGVPGVWWLKGEGRIQERMGMWDQDDKVKGRGSGCYR